MITTEKIIRSLIASSLLMLALPTGSFARKFDYRQNITFSIGGEPAILHNREFPRDYWNSRGLLYDTYEPRFIDIVAQPVFSLSYNRYLKNRIMAGGSIGYSYAYGNMHDPLNEPHDKVKHVHSVYLMPHARYMFISKRSFKLYSGLGAGVECRFIDNFGDRYTRIVPAWDVVPVGIEYAGRKVFLMTEMAVGSGVMGARWGVGYRF